MDDCGRRTGSLLIGFMIDKLEVMVARIEERQIANCDKLDRALATAEKHDERITKLEETSWRSAGAAGAMGAVAGAVAAVAAKLWK